MRQGKKHEVRDAIQPAPNEAGSEVQEQATSQVHEMRIHASSLGGTEMRNKLVILFVVTMAILVLMIFVISSLILVAH